MGPCRPTAGRSLRPVAASRPTVARARRGRRPEAAAPCVAVPSRGRRPLVAHLAGARSLATVRWSATSGRCGTDVAFSSRQSVDTKFASKNFVSFLNNFLMVH